MAAQARTSPPFREEPLSAMRRVTAARLLQAKQTIPHFYLQVDCRADELLDLRARLNAAASDVDVTITDLVVRAAALALRKVPQANSSWAENAIRIYDRADVAVAVATPAGLITPIVREADRKGIGVISRELKALAERARSGQLMPAEYTGGTFTVTNLGMYGIQSLYAIVNPPQSCILGVGAVGQRPVVRAGQLAVGSVMTCTLSADHRAIDGAMGAELLAEFRRMIEEPLLLLV
jgi:pyruvate dehydrogenase E2 component (dihydrolipoamide acetyltransferase)